MHKASFAKLNFEILFTQNTYCTLRNIRTVNECKAILKKPILWFSLLKKQNIFNIGLFYIVTLVTLLYTPERKVKMILKGCITIFEKISKS
jgi:hypothetical protein